MVSFKRKNKNPTPAAGIVVGGGHTETPAKLPKSKLIKGSDISGQPQNRPTKRALRINVITKVSLVGILLVLVSVGLFFALRKPSQYTKADGTIIKKMDQAELKSEVEKLIFENKFDSARELIKHQADNLNEELYTSLIVTYLNEDRTKDAIEIAIEADTRFPNVVVFTRVIAEQSEKQGDEQRAIDYYKKLKVALAANTNDPLRHEEISRVDQKLTELER